MLAHVNTGGSLLSQEALSAPICSPLALGAPLSQSQFIWSAGCQAAARYQTMTAPETGRLPLAGRIPSGINAIKGKDGESATRWRRAIASLMRPRQASRKLAAQEPQLACEIHSFRVVAKGRVEGGGWEMKRSDRCMN